MPFLIISRRRSMDVIIIFITYPPSVAIHETTREQVALQLSGIRVDIALQFASVTQTFYLRLVILNHVVCRGFHISWHYAFIHRSDHGLLVYIYIEQENILEPAKYTYSRLNILA
jgi:hypothetical protein